jgi:hypothetical protein
MTHKFKENDKVILNRDNEELTEGHIGYIVHRCMRNGYPLYQLDSGHWVSEIEIELLGSFNSNEEQYTGGSSDYYVTFVKNPTTFTEPYFAECNDIIEALEMDFAEGNAFKAIWRKAKARQGVKKKGYDNGVYDSEKVVFFGERMLVKAKEQE